MLPARPHCVHVGPVCHLDNELDIAIVVVVRASRHLHTMYCQQQISPCPSRSASNNHSGKAGPLL